MVTKRDFIKEYLKVLQENLPKEDMAEIFSGIASGEDVSEVIEQAMIHAKSPAEEEAIEVLNPYDPTETPTEDLIYSLRDSVVRLVFYKKDGSRRIMYATRNEDIIKLYDSNAKDPNKDISKDITDLGSVDKISQQVTGDYVKVFDLEKNEFRTFKPSKLAKFDKVDNVSSWIEFNPEYDAWYIMAKEDGDIHKFYTGDLKAKNIGRSKERKEYEMQARKDLQDAEYTREELRKQKEAVMNDPEYIQKQKEDKLKQVLEAFRNKHLSKFGALDEFSADFYDIYNRGKHGLELREEFTLVQADDENHMAVFEAFGRYILFHPHVLMDVTVKYPFFDLTDKVFIYPKNSVAKLSEEDKESFKEESKILNNLARIMTNIQGNIKRPLNPNYTDKDRRRALRMRNIAQNMNFAAADGLDLTQSGYVTKIRPLDSLTELKVSPYVCSLEIKVSGVMRHLELSRRKAPNSVLPMIEEVKDKLGDLYSKYNAEELLKINRSLEFVETAYNLRKTKIGEYKIEE